MPISPLVLQTRHAELGRIRIGEKDPDRGYPRKLTSFRFTSLSRRYVEDLGALYGGSPAQWDNNGVPSWQVLSESSDIPVLVVKGGVSQWFEWWQGGGIMHRCDGIIDSATGEPCDQVSTVATRVRGKEVRVNPHQSAAPTTRLSVILPELEAIGVWRLETHGWNAAAEIPAVAELAEMVSQMVPARLTLQERRTVKDGQVSRFVVPVLDLQVTAQKLRSVVASSMGDDRPEPISAGAPQVAEMAPHPATRPALSAAPAAAPPPIPSESQIQAASRDQLIAMGSYMDAQSSRGPKVDWQSLPEDELRFRVGEKAATLAGRPPPDMPAPTTEKVPPEPARSTPADPAQTPSDGGEASALWMQIVQKAGELGMATQELNTDFTKRLKLAVPSDATPRDMRLYLNHLTEGSES